MKIHFISIGGAVMHNLAIALHTKGYSITGSDDKIFDPSYSRLKKYGLLPENMGWFPNKISKNLDAVILGMHAKKDNPELIIAQNLDIKIYSFPEFIYKQTKNKIRVVIGGSHGKTTITSMIMHVLKENNIKFDYMVGSKLKGFDTMVGLFKDTKLAILEGDEYLSSSLDRRPKFHLFKPHIALLTGIAWDHINVFPTFENYLKQFEIFVNDSIEENGTLFYFKDDKDLSQIVKNSSKNIKKISYGTPEYEIKNQQSILKSNEEDIPLQIIGHHNMQNLNGARFICNQLGISDNDFYRSIKNFQGAEKRLQILSKNKHSTVFFDFAHSPSKLKATIDAVKMQYPNRKLMACLELHTYSSLNKHFLSLYKNTMANADKSIIYFNPQTFKSKNLEKFSPEDVKISFNTKNIHVFTDAEKLFDALKKSNKHKTNFLLMSSGDFNGKDIKSFAQNLLK